MASASKIVTLGVLGVLSFAGAACEDDDIGGPCGTPGTSLGEEPVGGEEPDVEIVRVQRDGACESFLCLRERGISPYCTRSCEKTSTGKKSCDNNDDCKKPAYCFEGICQDDDCPTGFWCREVQEVGPWAGRKLCVRKACDDNFDCEKLGELECRELACFDTCIRDGAECLEDEDCEVGLVCTEGLCVCAFHEWVCEPHTSLECTCGGEEIDKIADCDQADRYCTNPNSAAPFEEDKEPQWQGMCFHKEE